MPQGGLVLARAAVSDMKVARETRTLLANCGLCDLAGELLQSTVPPKTWSPNLFEERVSPWLTKNHSGTCKSHQARLESERSR